VLGGSENRKRERQGQSMSYLLEQQRSLEDFVKKEGSAAVMEFRLSLKAALLCRTLPFCKPSVRVLGLIPCQGHQAEYVGGRWEVKGLLLLGTSCLWWL
jgi:hypothetical protein